MSGQEPELSGAGGWVAGPALLSSEIGTLRFKTAYKDGPVPGYYKHVVIKLKVLRPDNKGFPSPAENEALLAIEEAVQEAAGENAHFVGSIAVRGNKSLLFYARSDDWVGTWEAAQRASDDPHEFAVTVTEEPQWDSYHEMLPLAEEAYGDILTFRQLDELITDINRPRQIDWFLSFAEEDQAQAAADELEAKRFRVEVRQAPGPDNWSVSVHADNVLDLGLIVRANAMLRHVAAEHGGNFDGWGAQIEPAPPT